jgi:hypothetical protein
LKLIVFIYGSIWDEEKVSLAGVLVLEGTNAPRLLSKYVNTYNLFSTVWIELTGHQEDPILESLKAIHEQ